MGCLGSMGLAACIVFSEPIACAAFWSLAALVGVEALAGLPALVCLKTGDESRFALA